MGAPEKKTLQETLKWMAGSEAKSYFFFLKNLNVSRGGAEENIEIRRKQN